MDKVILEKALSGLSDTNVTVDCNTPYDSPSPGGRELEGGGRRCISIT